VPSQLVEEVAREFQLDEVAPIVSGGLTGAQQSAKTQALLESLDELVSRLRQTTSSVPFPERKS
jgi:hypothetical protein